MSSIKLKHSGGNSIIISAPASNPASDRTLTLPSNADGTVLTTTNPATGNVVQNVNAVHSTQVTTSDGSVVDTGLTANITLTYSDSKVLIFVTQQLMTQQYNNTGDSDCGLILTRVTSGSSTNIYNGSAKLTSCRTSGEGNGSWFVRSANLASIVSEDTPGAGTHTYKTRLKHKSRSGTSSRTCDDSHPAEIILLEVAV